MPLYSYECQKCGNTFDEFRRYDDRDRAPEHCGGGEVRRVFTAPMIVKDYEGYVSPATGKWIEGRRAHIEDLARSGCRIKEPGETAAYMKKAASGQLEKERQELRAEAVNEAVNDVARGMGFNVGK